MILTIVQFIVFNALIGLPLVYVLGFPFIHRSSLSFWQTNEFLKLSAYYLLVLLISFFMGILMFFFKIPETLNLTNSTLLVDLVPLFVIFYLIPYTFLSILLFLWWVIARNKGLNPKVL